MVSIRGFKAAGRLRPFIFIGPLWVLWLLSSVQTCIVGDFKLAIIVDVTGNHYFLSLYLRPRMDSQTVQHVPHLALTASEAKLQPLPSSSEDRGGCSSGGGAKHG